MKAVVIYESMYGNTHLVATEIAAGMRPVADVAVVPIDRADAQLVSDADLVVVGGPTHAHGLSRESTRKAAIEAAAKPGAELVVDPDAEGPGLRDWFDTVGAVSTRAAAFDTRVDLPAALTGRASKGIAKRLRDHGAELVVAPESFLVTRDNHLVLDENTRARAWGQRLAGAMAAAR